MNGKSCFCLGLSAIAGAADVASLDAVRRTIDAHSASGFLTASQRDALVAACIARVDDLVDPAAMVAPVTVAARSSTTPAPAIVGVPVGFKPGEYAATVTAATERTFDDTGVVLMLTIEATIGGDRVSIGARFDEKREFARKAAFRACGVMAGADPSQLVGKVCRVALDVWTGNDGRERLSVKRWIASASGPSSRSSSDRGPSVVPGGGGRRPARTAWQEDDDGIPF